MFGFKKDIMKLVPGSECIPYTRHVNKMTVKTKKGDLVRFYEVAGIDFQTRSEDALDAWSLKKERMLKSISHPRLSLGTTLIHERYDERLESQYTNEFCKKIHKQYSDKALKDVYINRYFLTVMVLGSSSLESFRDSINEEGDTIEDAESIKLLDNKCLTIEHELKSAGLKPLVLFERNGQLFSEAASFIGRIYNGRWQEQPVTHSDLCETIPSAGVAFSKEVIGQMGISGAEYGAILLTKDFEEHTHTNQFNDLLKLPFSFILSQSYTFISQTRAIKQINDYLADMQTMSNQTQMQQDDLAELKQLVSAGKISLGRHYLTLYSSDKDIKVATNNIEAAAEVLRGGAIIATKSVIAAQPAWLAQFHGNFSDIPYAAPITNRNGSHFNSFHNYEMGHKTGHHWGDAFWMMKTNAGTPYYFCPHVADVGHMSVYGMTGSGKSMFQNWLTVMVQKFSPRVNIFDSQRNAEPLIKALDGQYFDFEIGSDSGLAPLQLKPTRANIDFCKELVEMLVTSVKKDISIKDKADLGAAVDSVMSDRNPVETRTLTSLLAFLPNVGENNLHDRLLMWTGENTYGWVFDNKKDRLNLTARNLGFNVDSIVAVKEAKIPIMAYLWKRIDLLKNGDPMITIFDEGASLLDHPFFENKIKTKFNKGRKDEELIIFSTQSPDTAVESSIHSAIVGGSATTIFLANPDAHWETYKQLNVTEAEFQAIKEMTLESRTFLQKKEQKSVVLNFDLGGISDYLPVLSASKKMLPVFDSCVETYGDEWLEHYIKEVKNV